MAFYADSFFLPFSLLLARTFLPLAVLILFLKPCTLLLCLFFGWYVLSILNTSCKMFEKQVYINSPIHNLKTVSAYAGTVNIIHIFSPSVKLFLIYNLITNSLYYIWKIYIFITQDAVSGIKIHFYYEHKVLHISRLFLKSSSQITS